MTDQVKILGGRLKFLCFAYISKGALDQQYKQLIELLLPAGILDYFELTKTAKDATGISIYLEEKNLPSEEYKDQLLHSKGFLPETAIQDFPIQGQEVALRIKRRRREVQSTGQMVTRNWTLVRAGA